ncbi:hypothetical protein BHE74_00022596 [Ensete ventricosum]|nr:hypothetical protein BHE74_00022596 [Ensete ventricosum]
MSVTIDAGCCIGPAAARSLPRRKRTILASETRLSVTLQQEDAQATVCGNSEPTGKMLVGEGGDHLPAGCLQGWPPTAKLLIWAIACGHGLACRPLQGRRSSAGVIARGQQCPPAKAEATMPTHRGGRHVVNFKALRGMPCVPFATRAAPPPTQEELVEAPEVRPHEGGDTYSKKKPKLGVHKVFRSITARVDCGTKEGHGGDGSGARSPRGKEHVMVTVANPTVGKTPVHGR